MELLLGKTMKIFISGTYPSSKDPGGKFWFQLQIFKFWVWLDSVKALEPLFDLQEAQGKTSNMAPKPTFRRGNLEKSSAPYWCDAPNLGAPKFFWEASYTYILRIKRVFEVLSNFAFCWTNPPQIPDYSQLDYIIIGKIFIDIYAKKNFSIS